MEKVNKSLLFFCYLLIANIWLATGNDFKHGFFGCVFSIFGVIVLTKK